MIRALIALIALGVILAGIGYLMVHAGSQATP